MAKLDPEVVKFLKAGIELVLSQPREYLERFAKFLSYLGIEPELEAILAFIAGDMYGTADLLYLRKYGRHMTDEEKLELLDFLAKELSKIRQSSSEIRK